MAKYSVDSSTLTDIADAIRLKNSTSTPIHVKDYAKEIQGIDSGYDIFWDSYQKKGTRTDYQLAFAGQGWTDDIFKPKYPINVTYAFEMFRDCNLSDLSQFDIDFSSNTSFSNFAYSSEITHFGVIDTRSSNALSYSFYGCTQLETIDKLILRDDGTQTLGGYQTFQSCTKLKNLTIEGMIGNTCNFQGATKLSKQSLTGIVNALSTSSVDQSITFKEDCVDYAFAEQNLFEVLPNTDTYGDSVTNTTFITKQTTGTVAGLAPVEGGKQYALQRNIVGKTFRYFFYDTYPLDTGAISMTGQYVSAGYDRCIVTAPENAKYIVIRAADKLTDEEMETFECTCGLVGSTSSEWEALVATKTNWTIALV